MNAQYTIQIEGDDVEGHRMRIGFAPDESGWLDTHLGGDAEQVRLSLVDDDDTEGHLPPTTVRVRLTDDQDDTEGHAISMHFPSVQEADAFRRRLVASGLITATIALGAVGGVAVGQQLSAGPADSTQANQAWQDASAATADRQGTQLSAGQAYSEAAANEAARQGAGAQAAVEAQNAYSEAAANEAARQGAGTQAAAEAQNAYSEAAANEAARQGAGTLSAAEAQSAWEEASANEAARQAGGSASSTDDDGNAETPGLGPR